jgi:hypothetical protein
MMALAFAVLVLALSGCSASQSKLVWRARDVALTPAPTIALEGRDHQIVVTVPTPTIQKLLLAHLRITRSAGTQAELFIVEGADPNAFAGLMNGRRVIGINVAMLKLIGDDLELYAALLGHETAHWAKGHVDASNVRSTTIQGIGTAIGVGLGAAGVPAAGLIAGVGADMIDTSYTRDDEWEADGEHRLYVDQWLRSCGCGEASGKIAQCPGWLAHSVLEQPSQRRGTNRKSQENNCGEARATLSRRSRFQTYSVFLYPAICIVPLHETMNSC